MNATPCADAYARKTPTWQLTVSPAVPVVLAGDAAGFPPLLEEAGLVDDEDASRLVAEVVDDVLPEVVADTVGVPGGSAQQALHAPRPGLPDRLGELPAVLALHPLEQPCQIAPGPFACFGASEAVSDPCVHLRQRVRALSDHGAPYPLVQCVHGALPCTKGQAYRSNRISVAVGLFIQPPAGLAII
jgi:hypothetical protein